MPVSATHLLPVDVVGSLAPALLLRHTCSPRHNRVTSAGSQRPQGTWLFHRRALCMLGTSGGPSAHFLCTSVLTWLLSRHLSSLDFPLPMRTHPKGRPSFLCPKTQRPWEAWKLPAVLASNSRHLQALSQAVRCRIPGAAVHEAQGQEELGAQVFGALRIRDLRKPAVLLRQHVSSARAGPLLLSSSESGLPPSPSEISQMLPHQDPPWASCSLGGLPRTSPAQDPLTPRGCL